MIRSSRISSVTVLACLIVCTPYTQAKNVDVFELSLQELMNTPVQVAAKRDTLISESPSSITTYSGEQLSQMGLTHLTQLLSIIPGFYAMYNPVEGNQSYLVTRGHSQKYASNILLLVNGQRLNDDYTGGISYFNRHMPLTFVKRVEIIRGPGSALYGSNAFNGVINIITQPQANLSVAARSFEGHGASIGFHNILQEAEVSLGIQYQADKGDSIPVEFDRFDLQTKTQDPREQLHLDLQLGYQNLSWQTLYYESKREDYYLFRRLRDGTTELNLSQLNTGITWHTKFNSNLSVKAYAQYQTSHRKSLTALALQDVTDYPNADFLFGEDIDYESYRVGVDIQKNLSLNHQWDNGIEWVSSQVPNGFLRSNYNIFGAEEYLGEVVTFKNNNERTVQDKTRVIESFYSQVESQWQESTRSMIGVRYDHYNDTGSKWSPRIALIHAYSASTTWKIMYSEAYRAPSLGDLYDEESGLTVGSENLNPSTIESFELSFSYFVDKSLLNVVIFNNNIHDLIGFRTQNNNTFLDNVTDSHSQGIEWDWTWVLSSNLKIKNQATHILDISSRSEAADLTPIEDLSPMHFGVSELHWRISKNLNSFVGLHWRSPVKILQDNDHLKIWHGRIQYSMPSEQVVSFSVRNITDETYSTGSAVQLGTLSNGSDYQEYPSRGREWSINYQWQW